MKVIVTMAVEVDPAAWAELYGDGPGMSRRAIREDVKQYVRSQVALSAAADEGAILSAYVRNGG
jgi:hypothetical protein